MNRRSAFSLALKVLGLALIIHAANDFAGCLRSIAWAREPLSRGHYVTSAYDMRVAAVTLIDIVIVLVLICFADRVARMLVPGDEPFPVPTSPEWQPSVFAIALRFVGSAVVALGIIRLYGKVVDYLQVGELKQAWMIHGMRVDSSKHWEEILYAVLVLVIGGYLMTGASALVNLLYKNRGVEDA